MKYKTHRRASRACGGNGPYSTYSETIHSFLLRFFLIFLSFALFSSPLFSPSSLLYVYFKHLSKGTWWQPNQSAEGRGALCVAPTYGQSRKGEDEKSPWCSRLTSLWQKRKSSSCSQNEKRNTTLTALVLFQPRTVIRNSKLKSFLWLSGRSWSLSSPQAWFQYNNSHWRVTGKWWG